MTMEVYHDGGFNLPIATLRTRRERRVLPWIGTLCLGLAIGIFGTVYTLSDPFPRCVPYNIAER